METNRKKVKKQFDVIVVKGAVVPFVMDMETKNFLKEEIKKNLYAILNNKQT